MSYFCGRKNSTKQACADFDDLTGKANRTNGYSLGDFPILDRELEFAEIMAIACLTSL